MSEPKFPFKELCAQYSLIFNVSLICSLNELLSLANIFGLGI